MKTKTYSVLLLLLALCLSAKAEEYYCKHIDISDGLSQPSVTAILSDTHDAVWIGTVFGLNKYRSNSITKYLPTDEGGRGYIKGNRINLLFLDSSGGIWAASESALSVYDASEDNFKPVANEMILSAYETDSLILFGGRRGVLGYDKRQGHLFEEPFAYIANSYIISMIGLEDGNLLCVDRGLGLFTFNPLSHACTPIPVDGLDGAIIMDACLHDGVLYVAVYNKGIYAVDLRMRKVTEVYDSSNSALPFNIVLCLEEIDSLLWIGTDGDGMCVLDSGKIIPLEGLLTGAESGRGSNSISVLYKDGLDNIWAGSVREGAYCLGRTDLSTISPLRNGIPCDVIISMCRSEDGIYIGTDGGGVCKYPSDGDRLVSVSPSSLKISSITELDSERMLISVYGRGLFTMDKRDGTTRPFYIVDRETNLKEQASGCIPMVYKLSDGTILILAVRAFLYDPSAHEFVVFNKGEYYPNISGMQVCGEPLDYDGSIVYTFSNNGIFSLNKSKRTVNLIYPCPEGITINTASFDGERTVWIGTNEGLWNMDVESGEVNRFLSAAFRRVTYLQSCEDGTLWIAADNILFRKDGDKIEVFDESYGFPANEILCGTITQNRLYLGGTGGFVDVSLPIQEHSNKNLMLELYDVEVGGKILSCNVADKIEIPWNYASLTLGVNLKGIDPFTRELYRYTLAGPDVNYQTETFMDRISFQNLGIGSYQISVSYLQKGGDWSPEQTMLFVTVSPPWYRKWWAYVIYAVVIIAVIFYSIYSYNSRKEKHLANTLSRWVSTSSVPQSAASGNAQTPEQDLMGKVNGIIEKNISNVNLNVTTIASEMAMSRASLYSKVKAACGMGVAAYVEDIRLRQACKLLKETTKSIAEISEAVGFSSPNYFSSRFKQVIGITPLTFRKESK